LRVPLLEPELKIAVNARGCNATGDLFTVTESARYDPRNDSALPHDVLLSSQAESKRNWLLRNDVREQGMGVST
jgi:hypothetical protein